MRHATACLGGTRLKGQSCPWHRGESPSLCHCCGTALSLLGKGSGWQWAPTARARGIRSNAIAASGVIWDGNQSSPQHYWRRNSGFGCTCTRITSQSLNAFMAQLKPIVIFPKGKPYPSRVDSASLELTGPWSLCSGCRAADRLGRSLSARDQQLSSLYTLPRSWQ